MSSAGAGGSDTDLTSPESVLPFLHLPPTVPVCTSTPAASPPSSLSSVPAGSSHTSHASSPPFTSTVAILAAPFDPITSAELRLAAEVSRSKDVDLVVLVPHGAEYTSVDDRYGGLLPLSRFLLAHAGVESTLPPHVPVCVVGLPAHQFKTDTIMGAIRHWAAKQSVRLVRVQHRPMDGEVSLQVMSDASSSSSSPPSPSSPSSLDLPLELPGGFAPCFSLLPEDEVRSRLKAKAVGVRALVPRLVLSIMDRYGLYFRGKPATPHWWYTDGWKRLSEAPSVPPSEALSPPSSPTALDTALSRSSSWSSSCPTSVSIFGGSFAPITSGHMEIAAEALNSGLASQVWYVPCGRRPDKPSLVMPVLDRYLHCLLAVEDVFDTSDPVYVCPIEVPQPKALPSVEVISRLTTTYTDTKFEMFIGADLVPTLHKWAHADALLRDVHFLVTPRPGTDLSDILEPSSPVSKPPLPDHIRAVKMPGDATLASTSLSSTEIRDRGVEVDDVAGLVPAPVLAHITRYSRTSPPVEVLSGGVVVALQSPRVE